MHVQASDPGINWTEFGLGEVPFYEDGPIDRDPKRNLNLNPEEAEIIDAIGNRRQSASFHSSNQERAPRSYYSDPRCHLSRTNKKQLPSESPLNTRDRIKIRFDIQTLGISSTQHSLIIGRHQLYSGLHFDITAKSRYSKIVERGTASCACHLP